MFRLPAFVSLAGIAILLGLLVGCENDSASSYLINLDQQNGLTLKAGEQVQLNPTVQHDGAPVPNPTLVWSVEGDIGVVSSTGMFTATTTVSSTAHKTGTVKVSGYGQMVNIPITVTEGPLAALSIIPPAGADLSHVLGGATLTFTAEGQDQYGNRGATRFAVTPTWSVDGGIGAITADGQFHATASGAGKIVATIGTLRDELAVTVVPGQLHRLVIDASADPTHLLLGDQVTFTAVGVDEHGIRGGSRIPVNATLTLQGGIGTLFNGVFTATKLGSGKIIATSGALTAERAIAVVGRFNGSITYVRQDGNANLMQLGGTGNPVALSTGAHTYTQPAWSPDGKWLLFVMHGGGGPNLWVMDVANGNALHQVYNGTGTQPAWSPDGSKIAFCNGAAGVGEICVIDLAGTVLHRLAAGALGRPTSPCWSPDGKKIAFCVNTGLGITDGIFVTNADGTGQVSGVYSGSVLGVRWSPSASMLTAADTEHIMNIPLLGGVPQVLLTASEQLTGDFAWSPDGRALCYSILDGQHAQLRMKVNGVSTVLHLTDDANASALAPCWKN